MILHSMARVWTITDLTKTLYTFFQFEWGFLKKAETLSRIAKSGKSWTKKYIKKAIKKNMHQHNLLNNPTKWKLESFFIFYLQLTKYLTDGRRMDILQWLKVWLTSDCINQALKLICKINII
jgi:hypothetical protein